MFAFHELIAPVTDCAMVPPLPFGGPHPFGDHSRPSTSTPVSLTLQPPLTVWKLMPFTFKSGGAANMNWDKDMNRQANIIVQKFLKFFFFITTAAFLVCMFILRFMKRAFKSHLNYTTYCQFRKLTVKSLDKSTFGKLRYMFSPFIIRGFHCEFSVNSISLLPIPQASILPYCRLIFL